MASSNIIKLNIGGTLFQTTKSTLTKFDGFFRTMFESDVPTGTDMYGYIFIDRDPQHFRLILNFMRDGNIELPESLKELKEVRKEAQYYLLEELLELSYSKILLLAMLETFGVRIPHYVEPSNEIRFLRVYEEAEKILSSLTKPFLIVEYTDSILGNSFCMSNAEDFVKRYSHCFEIVFMKHNDVDPWRCFLYYKTTEVFSPAPEFTDSKDYFVWVEDCLKFYMNII